MQRQITKCSHKHKTMCHINNVLQNMSCPFSCDTVCAPAHVHTTHVRSSACFPCAVVCFGSQGSLALSLEKPGMIVPKSMDKKECLCDTVLQGHINLNIYSNAWSPTLLFYLYIYIYIYLLCVAPSKHNGWLTGIDRFPNISNVPVHSSSWFNITLSVSSSM